MIFKNFIFTLTLHVIYLPYFVEPVKSNVYNYDPKQFSNQINELDGNFIMFYAPWCQHCTDFEPIWEELASMVNTMDSKFAIAKVDCTVYDGLCNENDITGYPSLLYFSKKDFKPVEYKGTRDLPSLTLFLSDMFNKPIEGQETSFRSDEVKIHGGMAYFTEHNIEKYISKGQHFIMFYAPWCKNSQTQSVIWAELAADYAHNKSINIGKINCMDYAVTCHNFDVKEYPIQLWILDGKVLASTSSLRSLEQLKDFINKYARPEYFDPESYIKTKRFIPVVRISEDTFDMFMKKELVIINFYVPWCAHCMQMLHSWLRLGHKFENETRVVIAEVDCSLSSHLCAQEDVSTMREMLDGGGQLSDSKMTKFPTLVLYKDSKVIFKDRGSVSMEEITQLIEDNVKKLSENSDLILKDEL